MRHLCDVNVWLALTLSAHVHADAARVWMQGLRPDDEACFCRHTEMAFLRLLTTPAAVGENLVMTNTQAQDLYLKLRTDERIGWMNEPSGLREVWFRHTRHPSTSPKPWADAYLAALVQLSDATLVTFDRGFRVYAGLRTVILKG